MSDLIIKYWAEWVCGIVGSFFIGYIVKYRSRQKALEMGVQALLRGKLIDLYNKDKDRDEIPIYELENIEALYREYKNLGGNGTITELVERLKEKPTPKAHE